MRVLWFDAAAGAVERGSEELLERWRRDPDTFVWLDFDTVSSLERESLLEGELNIHPLALQDAMRERHPPKVEYFAEHLFVMLREFDAQTTDFHFGYIGVSMFIGPNFLVTRSTGPSVSIDRVWNEFVAGTPTLGSPGAVMLRIAELIVRRYLPILLDLEPRLDEIEQAVFDQPDDALLAELTRMKARLKEMRRIFVYHDHVLREMGLLKKVEPDETHTHEINNVNDQVQRCASLAQLYYEIAADLAEAYLGMSSHRLNQVMKILTIITVIFVPLSFLAGIYGMNFENIPELKTDTGYYVLLTVMGCIIAAQLFLFKMKKWL